MWPPVDLKDLKYKAILLDTVVAWNNNIKIEIRREHNLEYQKKWRQIQRSGKPVPQAFAEIRSMAEEQENDVESEEDGLENWLDATTVQ